MHALNYFEHVTAATHISISFFLLIYFLHEYIDILLITNWKKKYCRTLWQAENADIRIAAELLGLFFIGLS